MAQLSNWGSARPIPDPPVGEKAGMGRAAGPDRAMIFGFGE